MKILPKLKIITKQSRAAIWQSEKWVFKIIHPIYRVIRFTYFFSINQAYRQDRLTQLKYHKHILQPNSTTSNNRYPELFKICSDFFAEKKQLKILSLGCSTGEEVFSLSKYLPDACIIGVDINKFCLIQAVKNNSNANLSFIHSLSPDYLTSSNYDAIFCLAVLQHSQNRANVNIAKKFTFKRFGQQVQILDQKLKAGGLLIIDHSDFNFEETKTADNYRPLKVTNNKIVRARPTFNQFNLKISNHTNNYRVYIKN